MAATVNVLEAAVVAGEDAAAPLKAAVVDEVGVALVGDADSFVDEGLEMRRRVEDGSVEEGEEEEEEVV